MPEERGLYPRMVLEDQLVFMAAIKGVKAKQALARMGPWLERLSLADWRKRKTNELSKGMQQKAQFIATVLHQPEVLIVDEPISGLDPVAMDVMREALVDLRRDGTTIVLSSHQMETVEQLCDRVALINRGEKILDGAVSEVDDRKQLDLVRLPRRGAPRNDCIQVLHHPAAGGSSRSLSARFSRCIADQARARSMPRTICSLRKGLRMKSKTPFSRVSAAASSVP